MPPTTGGALLMDLVELDLAQAMQLVVMSSMSHGLLSHGKEKILSYMFIQHLMILEICM